MEVTARMAALLAMALSMMMIIMMVMMMLWNMVLLVSVGWSWCCKWWYSVALLINTRLATL